MSADQRTAPDLGESGAAPVTSFRFPAPRIFAGNNVPTLDRKPAARVISTKPNNTCLERCIGKPFSQRPENL